MATKSEVSSNYMERQKLNHASKPLAEMRRALIIGADPGNIGNAINNKLSEDNFFCCAPHILDLDVNSPANYPYRYFDTLILANGWTHLDWFEDQTHGEIAKAFDINVVGSLKTANSFVNETIDAPYKKYIVFIGSMAYRNVLNGSAAYCASKAALAMATRCLAWELAPKGYNVFCVHPSNTEGTPMTEKTIQGLMEYRGLSRKDAEAYWGASLPKEKWLQPSDIAETVSFLVSGKADYMSGSNVELAGGQR